MIIADLIKLMWEHVIMLSDLGKLIELIEEYYDRINQEWDSYYQGERFNLKRKQVVHVKEKMDILEMVLLYCSFINEKVMEFVIKLGNNLNINLEVTSRVKQQNSIQYKIDSYIQNHANGKIPIKKCLNDLFGIRIILNENIEYNDIKQYMDESYSHLKCIDASKGDYVAVHIYFQNNNSNFPWELQIWCRSNEDNNIKSHKEYKQDYTKWESENCGVK